MKHKTRLGAIIALPFVAVGTAWAGLRIREFGRVPKRRRALKLACLGTALAARSGRFLFAAGRKVERAKTAILSRVPFAHR